MSKQSQGNSGASLPPTSNANNKRKQDKRRSVPFGTSPLDGAVGRVIETLEGRMMMSVTGFQPAVNVAAGAAPRAVAVGDLNGDNKLDAVVANQTGNNVSVLLGNGSGGFATAVNYAAGTGPRAVTLVDLNGDNKLDIVVANQTAGSVSVLINNGNGTFAAAQNYAVGSNPLALVTGDFNGDNKQDVAVANFGAGNVSVLTGKGDGTFNAAVNYAAGTGPNGIAAADFNGDNKTDLVVANSSGGVSVLTNNGSGAFGAPASFATGTSPKAVIAADFDGDGKQDLAVVNGTSNNVSVLKGNGDGTFATAVNYAVGTGPDAITSADFNNDGKLDLAVVNAAGSVSILSGNGDATFAAATSLAVGTSPQAIAWGDFNRDGSIDLLAANQGGNNVSVLLDKHITATGADQATIEGTALSGVTVASFADSEAGTVNTDYVATINWGDGTITTGSIAANGNGGFDVTGTHAYADEGVYAVTTRVVDTLGNTATAAAQAVINDADLTAGASVAISATEGAAFSGNVARFSDGNTAATTGEFLAVIDWGDGTSGTGTIVSDGGGAFHVTGTHTWQHKASKSVTVDVLDNGGAEVVVGNTATIAEAAIHAAAATPTFTEGSAGSTQTIATFTDDNPFGAATEFGATIHWGDGSQSTGTIVALGNSAYAVKGSHNYAHAGSTSVQVDVTSVDGASDTVTFSRNVANATLAANKVDFSVVEGQPTGSTLVATFTDANASASDTDFTAAINWGDGTSDPATVTANGGHFDVTAPTHTYDHAGHKTGTVTITGLGGGVVTASPIASVTNDTISTTAHAFTVTEGHATGSTVVGSFTDPNAAASAADFTATVTWGDGTTGTGTIAWNAGLSRFDVSAGHTYSHAGTKTFTVKVDGAGGGTASGTAAATVNDDTIAVTTAALSATEGSSFSGTVAHFTDANALAAAGDFGAAIHWGDATTTAGTVVANVNGGFDVTGAHTYAEEGAPTVQVTITGAGGSVTSDSHLAAVADAALHSTGQAFTATEGQATGSTLVATFTDDNPGVDTTEFAAVIHWGDGTQSTGAVTWNGGSHVYEVHDAHTYDHAGDKSVSVVITDTGTATTTAAATATVNNDTVTAAAGAFGSTEGQSGTAVVAHFTDPNANAAAADFTAQVTWGDGSTTAGVVSWNAGLSRFDVTGTHTYLHAGSHPVAVSILGAYGEVANETFNAAVANAAIAVTGAGTFHVTEGAAFTGQLVGTFTDANASAAAGDFTATIDWGDGTATSTGAITAGAGAFNVKGDHTYAHAGNHTVTVTVNGAGGGSDHNTATAAVDNATLTATKADFTATEGTATGSVVVANFSDVNASAVAGDFSATIAWGDGNTDTATIASDGNGGFNVTAPTHTYAHAGNRTTTVTITGAGGGNAVAHPVATVHNDTVTAAAGSFSSTEGQSGTGVVAHFTDVNAAAVAGDFSAVITWGDGATSAGVITWNAGQSRFDVSGTHTYAHAGSPTASVSIVGAYGAVANTGNFAAAVANDTLTGNGVPVTATEGVALTGVVVGHFTDANASAVAADFTATILWGDGNTTAGTVVAHQGGGFDVVGDHTYAHAGAKNVTFGVLGAGGGTATGGSTATVNDAAITVTAGTINAVEGAGTGSVLVGTFTDANALAAATDFTAVINWGDGGTDAATVTANAHGGFDVTAPTHTYAHAGTNVFQVIVTGAGGSIQSDFGALHVANATLTGAGTNVSATEGVTTGAVLAGHFTDSNAAAVAADFGATIDWGDGTTTTGTITWNAGASRFDVTGAHTYLHAGSKPVAFTVTGNGGGTTGGTSTATIANATLTGTPGTFSGAVTAASFSGIVGHFTDANAAAVAADFTASINWGDGTTTTGAVVTNILGGFDVTGTHTFAHEGAASVVSTVTGLGNGTTTSTFTGTVADAPLTASGVAVSAIEGTTATGRVVANFTDADPLGQTSDFSATIAWGDGSSGAGTVVADGSGGWNVTGTHLYATAGNYAVVTTINDAGGATKTAASVASVVHGTITASAPAIAATEGSLLLGSTVWAHFTDTNQSVTPADFTATVTFGDGSSIAGAVVVNGGGGFDVIAPHTYAHAGPKTYSVAVSGAGDSKTAGNTAAVANAAMGATGKVNNAVEGTAFSGVVGSFTDANASAVAGDFTATIDWGDGTSGAGTITWNNATSKFDVSGTHNYAIPGGYTTGISVAGLGGGSANTSGLMGVADATLNPSAVTIHATEGTAFTGKVASFQDGDHNGQAGDFTVSIDWGDGTTTAGTLVANGNGQFDVTGNHTWTSAASRSVVVTLNDFGGANAQVSSTAIVADATLTAVGQPVSAVEGAALTNVLVASFTDANPLASAGDFTAAITWGDGTTSAGTVTWNGDLSRFDVTGTHTYNHAGAKSISTVIGDVGGAGASAGTTATIANATLSIAAGTIAGTEGAQIVANVAHFTDANALASATDFSAVIDWGDGSTSVAAISAHLGGGFDVLGAHAYADAGDYTVGVNLTGNGGGSQTTSLSAHVANATLTATPKTLTVTEGQPLTGQVVAHFADANAFATAGAFTATINWGDEVSEPGTIVANVNGGFDVVGTHTYAHSGDKTVTVALTGNGGGTASASSTVHVTNDALASTGNELSVVEGQPTGAVTLANFTDANAAASAGDFTATIAWGDGNTDTGTVVADGEGGFNVTSAGHAYAHAGDKTVTVLVTGNGGGTTQAATTVHVTNDAMQGADRSLSGTEGQPITNGVVAHFTDANASASAGDFTAYLNWDDGASTLGTVVANVNGGFDVQGTHTYAHAGNHHVDVTVTGNGGGEADATGVITVNNASLTAANLSLTSTEGAAFTGTAAHFTDANAAASAGDFTATIAWGDGSTGSGTVVANDAGGFDVTGTHAYATFGTRTVTVTLSGVGGGSAVAHSTMVTADAVFTVAGATLSSTEGQPLTNVVVASIVDPNLMGSGNPYTATITWGDGSATSAGTIVQTGAGTYNVVGSHTYAHAGNKAVSVAIGDGAVATNATAAATVHVANATLASTAAALTGATEGAAWTGKLASFTDANTAASIGDFTATVTWGDGSTSAGTVVAGATAGTFNVTGGHTWTTGGAKAVSVLITGAGGGTTTTSANITVAKKGINGVSGGSLSGVRGTSLTASIAYFTDTNPLSAAGDFTASINWGDGTSSAGIVSRKSATTFRVTGTHTYLTATTYTPRVTITDVDGDATSATATLKITRPAVASSGGGGGHTVGGHTALSHHQIHLKHLTHVNHLGHVVHTAQKPQA